MADSRRQISNPRDLGEGLFSRGGGGGAGGDGGGGGAGGDGGADNGEAWMRICLRLRAELGEEVFLSWFRCLELDGLSDEDAYLSVPTKFLQFWIRSHYVDRILLTLAGEFPAVKRISINVRSSARPSIARVAGGPNLSPCSITDPPRGRNQTAIAPVSPVGTPGSAMGYPKRPTLSQSGEEDLSLVRRQTGD
jgi:chromosomal replication initiator protein